jgi:hypothetical protein
MGWYEHPLPGTHAVRRAYKLLAEQSKCVCGNEPTEITYVNDVPIPVCENCQNTDLNWHALAMDYLLTYAGLKRQVGPIEVYQANVLAGYKGLADKGLTSPHAKAAAAVVKLLYNKLPYEVMSPFKWARFLEKMKEATDEVARTG